MLDFGIVLTHPSLADVPEGDLVAVVLGTPYWRSRLIDIFGIPKDAVDKQRVSLATAPGGGLRGDIDILLCNTAQPQKAVAYEVKRIKFGIPQVRKGKPSKLQKLEKAVRQANLLAHIGFWKVFLYIITVVDSREQNLGQTSYAGLSNELQQKLDSAVTVRGLYERVGLFTINFTQAMDNPPFTIDTSSGHIRRQATAVPQSDELTEWVARQFEQD